MPTQQNDIRWKQRFSNLERAFTFLQESSNLKSLDKLQMAGLVQAFEFTFELSWKTLKDYMTAMGIDVKFPRDTIKHAFQDGLIEDGHTWLAMLDKRNEFSHTYDDAHAQLAVDTIKNEFLPALAQVFHTLKDLYQDD